MQFEEITSQSGTVHIVNPKPTFTSSAGAAMSAARVQTLCEFHVRPSDSAPPGFGKALRDVRRATARA